MKNTDYKDVVDIGEEALSMDNKFSFPSMQKAFTIGENIRGMNNVSPLATVKLFNQSTEDILKKYYPDGNISTNGNTNIIEDINITVKNKYKFSTYNYYFDNNRNSKYGDEGDLLAFKLLLFVSNDGNKVRECYEIVQPKDDEVILFLESDSGELSKDVLFGKMSAKVRKQFTDDQGNLKSNLFDNEIMKAVLKNTDSVNQEIVEELMKNGYIKESKIKNGFFSLLRYVMLGVSAPAKALGWVLKKLGEGVDFLKISDNFWDTEIEGYFFKKDKLTEAFTLPTEKLKYLRNLFTDKKGFDFADLTPKFLDDLILDQLNMIEKFINNYNNYVKKQIEFFFAPSDPLVGFVKQNLTENIALLCGIWNGLVDFVASTLKFFGSLLEAPFDISKDFQHTLEMIDNFWDMLDMTLLENLWEAIKEGTKKIKEYLTSKDSDDLNWVRINYAAGFTISFIGTFFIPIADIAKVSEVGKMGEILAKINSEIGKTISQTTKFVKIQTAEAYQKVSKALEDLVFLFKEGGKKLQDFVNNLWKKIADWFLSNKKLLLYEGAGNEIRSTLAKVVDIASDIAPLKISQYEKQIFDLPTEWAGMITKEGEIINNITSNSRKAVDLIAKYGKKLQGAIVTHNHPRGNSLSTSDIRMFIFEGIKELRAVAGTDGSVFALRNLGERLTISEIATIQKNIVKGLQPSGAGIKDNALDVADAYIKELMKYEGRFEYIHYKKL
ncbi:zincin-like metallopeptidase toxin domain-containing protein [Chryseobacterium indologenes]|uniref:zincin-like metallopeptidase toxin domain-containing protein n=1 Tax=Chryseobacterium indologenes TaxID=253 RepID=UPI004058C8CE